MNITYCIVLALSTCLFSGCVNLSYRASHGPAFGEPADTNHWHTVTHVPPPDWNGINRWNKLNPIWWFQNDDDPEPPHDYRPGERHRRAMWFFRNSTHNLTFYVIGVADQKSRRSGVYPDLTCNPHGGWNFAVTHRYCLYLPFVSYKRHGLECYLGWRTGGNFGAKVNFHREKKK